jgi:hypothetical protein
MTTRNNLTKQSNNVSRLDEKVIFLTEPAKKKIIEELKKLESIKRNLLILIK